MDRVTTIDVSKKKGRRITESIIESVWFVTNDFHIGLYFEAGYDVNLVFNRWDGN